jgi:zinc transporter, ZIP family
MPLAIATPWLAVPLACCTAVSTAIGGLVALRLRRELGTVIAFSGGVVVAVAIFDVLPEAERSLGNVNHASWLIGAGFLGAFLANRFLTLHHRDDPDQAKAHQRVGAAGAAALSVHSVIDGLGIGLALHLSLATGLLVFLAVVSHDFADGLNTVTFVLYQEGERSQALRWLTADSVAPIVGATIGAAVSPSEHAVGGLLCLYVGFFLFLGASDLLPEAHREHPSRLRVALTVAGFVFIFAVVWLATNLH